MNVPRSRIVGLGFDTGLFKTAQTELYINGALLVIEGRYPHSSTPFTGNRLSVAAYSPLSLDSSSQ